MKEILAKLMAEIAHLEEKEKANIELCKRIAEENYELTERIARLRKAVEKHHQLDEELKDLGPLMEKEVAPQPKARIKISKVVPPIIENAGLSGVTPQEIIDFHHSKTGEVISLGSLVAYLYRCQHEGKFERRSNGCWRVKVVEPSSVVAVA